ncbi:MAG: DUF1674 domain-containing protein [Sphingomonadaceae bacterium]|nr:DUF1674 domain-containing protein [Sphingomonadaceae bacterium]
MADDPKPDDTPAPPAAPAPATPPEPELGGRKGLEPTRYGDWEKGGIAVDF